MTSLATTAPQKKSSFYVKTRALLSLTKIKITRTVVVTAFLGYYLAVKGNAGSLEVPFLIGECLLALFAIAAVCGGACAFNHILEWKIDAKMSRTKGRPLPSKLVTPLEATLFGSALTLLGLVIMFVFFSPLLAWGALGTGILYDFFYTPLKRISAWNTTLGALPGALPVLGGAVAANGTIAAATGGTASPTLSPTIWIAFIVVFLWQHPHFYAIAWTYRSDYAEADYKMITSGDTTGKRTFGYSLLFTLLLIIATLVLPGY